VPAGCENSWKVYESRQAHSLTPWKHRISVCSFFCATYNAWCLVCVYRPSIHTSFSPWCSRRESAFCVVSLIVSLCHVIYWLPFPALTACDACGRHDDHLEWSCNRTRRVSDQFCTVSTVTWKRMSAFHESDPCLFNDDRSVNSVACCHRIQRRLAERQNKLDE